jgi:hypothetical protein
MLCIQPLYLNSERYIGLTGHKYNFFVFCMTVISIAVILLLLAKLAGGYKLITVKNLSIADWALLAFALVTLASALFSPHRAVIDIWGGLPERHDGAITQLFYVLIFFIIAHWYKPRVRDFGIFGISAIIIGLIGVFQFYGMDFFRLWPNQQFMYDRITPNPYHVQNFYDIYFRSTLGNVNMVATYVCVAVLLCGFLYVKMEASKWRYVWLAGSASCFWLMIIGGSESGMVGVLVTVVLAIPFIIGDRKHIGKFLILASSWAGAYALQRLFYNSMILETEQALGMYFTLTAVLLACGLALTLLFKNKGGEVDTQKPLKWKLGVIVMAGVIAVGIAGVEVLGRQQENWRPIYEAREVLHGRAEDNFGSARVYIWRNALEAFPNDNPLIGSGPSAFWQAFPNKAETIATYGVTFDKAHNEYLQVLICQGVLGLLSLLIFLGYLFIKAVPRALENPLLMVVLAGFTGYCVQAFFNISLPIASQMLWVMAGVLASVFYDEKRKRTE